MIIPTPYTSCRELLEQVKAAQIQMFEKYNVAEERELLNKISEEDREQWTKLCLDFSQLDGIVKNQMMTDGEWKNSKKSFDEIKADALKSIDQMIFNILLRDYEQRTGTKLMELIKKIASNFAESDSIDLADDIKMAFKAAAEEACEKYQLQFDKD